MICCCAQSLASLANLFSPLPANVAAMGSVNGSAGAQAALNAALSAQASAAGSAAFSAAVAVPFSMSAMASLTALANGIGALRLGLRTNLIGSGCAPTLEQLARAIEANALAKALGGLPMSTLSPLQALAQLASALASANAMGVGLLAPNAAAQLNAQAQASAAAAANASVSASAALSMQAYLAMQASLAANLGVNIGAPGGVGMLGVALGNLASNMSALNALNSVLNAALLTQTLALLNALAAIQRALNLNMLLPGMGALVQPRLASLSKAFGPGAMSKGLSKSAAKSASKSAAKSASKSLAQSVYHAQAGGLGNLLSGLPILPPATLLLAYLMSKLLGQLGVGLVQYSSCGPLCTISAISLPCPFALADFGDDFASQGEQLAVPAEDGASDGASDAAPAAAPVAPATNIGEAVQYGAKPKSAASPATIESGELDVSRSPQRPDAHEAGPGLDEHVDKSKPPAAPPAAPPPPGGAESTRIRKTWWKK